MLVPASSPDSIHPSPLRVQLVAHTHWDREWYHPAARFRQRLVALVDALLDEAANGDAVTSSGPFLLDGQAIVLRDYASVRPERAHALGQLLRSGAIEAGPWFVLADNLIPSGEAILRNLEAGRRVLESVGAIGPAVAYCPDAFGHPAALPDIAAGYGFPVAVLWRGFGGAAHPRSDSVWWCGVSGARVLLHHLPPDGYETGSSLPVGGAEARARWSSLAETLRSRNRIGVALLPSGADHHARQSDLHAALAAAPTTAGEVGEVCGEQRTNAAASRSSLHVERASLASSTQRLFSAASAYESTGLLLPTVHGELRDSYGYTWTLQGTFATRAHEKRRNALLERALCYDVEPWLALAYLHGDSTCDVRDGSIGIGLLPSLLSHAWETLLTTHPHDTLCGCSIDEVARAMEAAQDATDAQQMGLREAALSLALQHDRVEARGRKPDDRAIVIRNRVPRARAGVAELRLLDTVVDVPVGPGSGGTRPLHEHAERMGRDEVIAGLATQLVRSRLAHDRRESPQHYPDDDIVRERRVLAWVPMVPAFGVRVLEAGGGERVDPPVPVVVAVTTGGVRITNGQIELFVDVDGVSVVQGGRELRNALSVETVTDAGDSYTPSLRGKATALSLGAMRVVQRGPLRGSVQLQWHHLETSRADVPSDVARYEHVASVKARRSRAVVTTTLILDAEAQHIRCDVRVRNRMRDHRLQLVWHTDVDSGATVRADAAFGHVERVPIAAPADTAEAPPSTMPLHRWVSSCDAAKGATLLSDGLAEAEVAGGRLAVTLLRAIGELSRGDLPERPGHAGWPCAIPLAQAQGTFRARVGLLLHSAWNDETFDTVEDAADALLLPLTGETWRDLRGTAHSLDGPELLGPGLRASAVTLARDGRALLLRARNLTAQPQPGVWVLPRSETWRVTECRLDEAPLGAPRIAKSRVEFTVPPRALLTLRIERAGG